MKPSAFEAGLYSQPQLVFKITEEKRREGLYNLTIFLNVHDDGTLNEVVNEERMQLERTEVKDERVKKIPPRGVNGNETETARAKKKVPRETP